MVRWVPALGALGALALGIRASRAYQGNVVDDAATSLRYAANWVAGHGLVFQAGERVEGYTNFLWVVVLAACRLSSQQLGVGYQALAVACNVVLMALAVGVTSSLARFAFADRWLPVVVTTLAVALDEGFTTWGALGLEGHLLALCQLAALAPLVLETTRWGVATGLAVAAALMTRPDAALFVLPLALVLGLRSRRGAADRRQALVALACAGLPYGAYFATRASYYGALLPNTFYLKVGDGIDGWARGGQYLASFVSVHRGTPLLALLALFAWRAPLARVLIGYLLLHAVYVAYVGGDFFAGHRLLVPTVPCLALALGAGCDALGLVGRRAQVVGVALVSWLGLAYSGGLQGGAFGLEVRANAAKMTRDRRFMTWLGAHKLPGSRLATGLIGHAGLYADIPVVDLYGVVDRDLARRRVAGFGSGKAGHEKMLSVDEVVARRPTYVSMFYHGADFWRHGYFLDTAVPRDIGATGIWTLDPLPATARRVGTSFDFEEMGGFVPAGDAFLASARVGDPPGVLGRYASSAGGPRGEAGTGTLTSPAFAVEGDVITLRLAGALQGTSAELVVDGEVVRRASGRGHAFLGRVRWDVHDLRGRAARLVLRDTSDTGSLAADELDQWRLGESGAGSESGSESESGADSEAR